MRQYNARRIPLVKAEIFANLGGQCANCGITDQRVLTIDHRFGGGGAHRRGGNGLNYYVRILKNLDGFRLLCHNCNWLAYHYGQVTVE